MMNYYVLFIEGDVTPYLHGPYSTDKERNDKARELKRKRGDEHGIFPMSVNHETEEVYVGWYNGGFFAGEDQREGEE